MSEGAVGAIPVMVMRLHGKTGGVAGPYGIRLLLDGRPRYPHAGPRQTPRRLETSGAGRPGAHGWWSVSKTGTSPPST